ncbi:MAG: transposase [Phycisphaeraceae bacterium]|nr:transposase [Phycisphaeraceae bacterium]
MCKRQGKVYTEVVADCSKDTILAAIRGKVDLRAVVHSDGFKCYDGLVAMGYKKHLRVDLARNEFSSRTIRGHHSKGIEGFWDTPRPGWRGSEGCTPAPSPCT